MGRPGSNESITLDSASPTSRLCWPKHLPSQKNVRPKSLTASRARPTVNPQLESQEVRVRTSIAVSRQLVSVLTFFAVLVTPALAGPNRWSRSSLGLASVARVIADPSDATRQYAVTTGGSVLKSTNGGLTWRPANQGLASLSISAFLIEPDSTTTLFAATDGVIFTSTDAAGHWSKAGSVDGTDVLAMAFEPASRRLFAGTARGLYVSGDNGKTWSNTAVQGSLRTVVVSPKSTILVSVRVRGLYASKDHGRTWVVRRVGENGIVAVDQNSTIYWFREGVARTVSDQVSSDDGATWHNLPLIPSSPTSAISSGDAFLYNVNVIAAAPGDLFLLGGQNLFEYTDRSGAWLPVGPPPSRKHTGGWTNAEREAWNLASRMRRHEDQVLRLLEDTRVPADNNTAERSFRFVKLHDKISGHFRSWEHAEAFLAVRSYLQTGAKHGRSAMELLTRLWTPTGAWLPSVAVPDTS